VVSKGNGEKLTTKDIKENATQRHTKKKTFAPFGGKPLCTLWFKNTHTHEAPHLLIRVNGLRLPASCTFI